MGKFFPPTVPEWHSSVVGFFAGFVFGATEDDSDVGKVAARAVLGREERSGHIAQARTEAAYAGACFVIGTIVGRAWSKGRNAFP